MLRLRVYGYIYGSEVQGLGVSAWGRVTCVRVHGSRYIRIWAARLGWIAPLSPMYQGTPLYPKP